MAKKTVAISAVLFYQGEQWVGQCLQYDVAAQASTLEDVQYELMRVLMSHAALDIERGVEPLGSLPQAPRIYWKKFDEGQKLVSRGRPRFRLPEPRKALEELVPFQAAVGSNISFNMVAVGA